jgi:3'-phosphoadenosine 5'-phosphosulfate sulfotransferase (PAPS reductase)/FAD synthetase
MRFLFLVSASYGNDSVALIQWCWEFGLSNIAVLYADTGWAHPAWNERVDKCETWVRTFGFIPFRTSSIGFENVVREKKGFPRQGIQFCTQLLKTEPLSKLQSKLDPEKQATVIIGKRRAESANRANTSEFIFEHPYHNGRAVWHPLFEHSDEERNALLNRAGFDELPHRSDECWPCINANKSDLKRIATEDPARINQIESLEREMGLTSKGKPRTMFRPYRYRGATGIRAMIRWAETERGGDFDDGTGRDCAESAAGCGL